MNKIGTIIDNKYEIKQYINKGGMSVVYLAVNTRLGNRWAIKEIKKTYDAQSRLYINSLIAEANLMKDIDSNKLKIAATQPLESTQLAIIKARI